MGCDEEYPAASGKTPGWEITSKDIIIEDLCGFKKTLTKEKSSMFASNVTILPTSMESKL
jgi:hypothetical protein